MFSTSDGKFRQLRPVAAAFHSIVLAPFMTIISNQGLDNELIVSAANGVGKVRRRERLGGLLRFYYRVAA